MGVEHFLLALLATPNEASDALAGVGVTHERVRKHLRSLVYDPDLPMLKARKGISTNPAAQRLVGWAFGFAAASGETKPRPEHWLIAMLHVDDRGAMWLHPFGVSAQAVIDALSQRGVRVPEFVPVEFQPWRGSRHVYVSRKEVQPIVDVLSQNHPPGSEWKWGFNLVGKPQRGRISAEEGIDLEGIVAQARAKGRP